MLRVILVITFYIVKYKHIKLRILHHFEGEMFSLFSYVMKQILRVKVYNIIWNHPSKRTITNTKPEKDEKLVP